MIAVQNERRAISNQPSAISEQFLEQVIRHEEGRRTD